MPKRPVSLTHWGAFEAEVKDGVLLRTRPWADSGADARMIGAIPELVYSDTRVRQPHVRESWLKHGHRAGGSGRGTESMVPVPWDTALDLVAAEIARVRDTYGHTALFAGSYGWSSAGRFHHARSQIRRFYGAVGGFTDQTGNYSWGAAQIILQHVLGSAEAVSGAATSWESICGNTDTFVAFGGLNPKNWHVTSGGAGHHHMPDHVRRVARNGTRFVVVSPSSDDIPEGSEADWIATRPGADTAIILALTQAMVARGRADLGFLGRYCTGADRLLDYLDGRNDGQPKTLEWAAALADVPLKQLQALADRIAQGRVMLTATWSLQRAQHGEMTYWSLIALACVLGQIGLPGGGFGFGYGSLNAVGHGATKGLVPQLPGLGNAHGTAIPVARLADMLEHPNTKIPFNGEMVQLPEVKLIHWAGGNPFHHAQDLFRLERLWQRPETIIVNEQFWTATARRADIVLPATTSVERNDIGGTSRDPHVFFMPQLIAPVGQARSDFAIFTGLAKRLGHDDAYTQGLDEDAWLQTLWAQSCDAAARLGIDAPDFDTLRAMNVWSVPRPDHPEILLAQYRKAPSRHPLNTPSGKIELYCERIASYGLPDVRPHPAWSARGEWPGDAAAGTYALLTPQPQEYLHSQLAQTGLARPAEVVMNADDASATGLQDGDQVQVSSPRGACKAIVRLTQGCRSGVVCMATGPWFQGGAGMDAAGNPNALTSDMPTSTLSQGSAAQSCLVTIAKL